MTLCCWRIPVLQANSWEQYGIPIVFFVNPRSG